MNLNEKTINLNDYSYLNFELIIDYNKNNYNNDNHYNTNNNNNNNNKDDNIIGINNFKNLTTHIIFKKSSDQIIKNKDYHSEQASCTVLGKFNLIKFFVYYFYIIFSIYLFLLFNFSKIFY
jgi:hypothetical protein